MVLEISDGETKNLWQSLVTESRYKAWGHRAKPCPLQKKIIQLLKNLVYCWALVQTRPLTIEQSGDHGRTWPSCTGIASVAGPVRIRSKTEFVRLEWEQNQRIKVSWCTRKPFITHRCLNSPFFLPQRQCVSSAAALPPCFLDVWYTLPASAFPSTTQVHKFTSGKISYQLNYELVLGAVYTPIYC